MSETENQATIAAKEESRQIVRETSIVGVPKSLAETVEIAKVMGASGLYPDYNTAQKAAGAIVIGAQYGLSPAQSLGAIHIVKGKPMLHYSLILAKVREHPDYDYRIVESTDDVATVEFVRHDAVIGRESFTIVQARKQGTQNLEKFPDTMLLARAVSKGVKKYCPDVLNGMPTYVQGELDEPQTAPIRKSDSLREKMIDMANAVEPSAEPVIDAEFVEAPQAVNPLDAYRLTEDEERDFRTLAQSNGYDLESVAASVEPKTKDALESALSVQGLGL